MGALVLALMLVLVPAASASAVGGAGPAASPDSTTTTVTASPSAVVTNQPVMLTATVAPATTGTPSGTVAFSTGRGPISGCAMQTVSASPGPYTATCNTTLAPSTSGSPAQITAAFTPNDNSTTASSSNPANVTVNPEATTTMLSVSPSMTNHGQSVTYTVTVSPSSGPGYGSELPTGVVTFSDTSGYPGCGSAMLSGTSPDTATCATNSAGPGSHQITAVYQASQDFASSSSTAESLTVNAPPSGSGGGPTYPPSGYVPPRPTPPVVPPRPVRAPRPIGAGGATPACTAPSAARIAANPLALSPSPGSNPLKGASFYVAGPAHGDAAGEIARLLGIDSSVPVGGALPAFPDSESWSQFLQTTVAARLPSASPRVQHEVQLLEKEASRPEAQRISVFSEGGTPDGIAKFTDKLFCHNFTADPGAVPIITTYLLHPVLGGCSSTSRINAYMPLFRERVNAIVKSTGSHRVVYLLELDAVGSSSCMAKHHALGAWEKAVRYEVDQMATLPHAVVYVEGGYSDSNNARYAAKMLNAFDIHKIRGFFTNDTHINWTSNEITYGNAVSRLTDGAHFIVSTTQNGHGPKLNPHPTAQGVEDLCNPPGRGLGPAPTTTTGFPNVDAFMWTFPPGNSGGSCHGGPASGVWWPARAMQLAAAANGQLGPHTPSHPY